MSISDNPAVIGAGTTKRYGKLPDRSRLELTAEALGNALDNAGIEKQDIDGLGMNYEPPLGLHYDHVAEALDLDVRWASQHQHAGRFAPAVLRHAAMVVERGNAEYAAIGFGLKWNNVSQVGGGSSISLEEYGSLHGMYPRPWYGLTAPAGASAMHLRYYMNQTGATSRDLAHVSKTLRDNAALDPKSHYSEPYSIEEHQASRWVVEPLHLYDCAATSDGGAFLIVTNAENAASFDDPAYITNMRELPAGRNNFVGGGASMQGMGIRTQQKFEYDPSVTDSFYRNAEIARDDIDAMYIYDAFAPNIWYGLETWGFTEPGTAYEFTRNSKIAVDGDLPVNTHGGHLSNGHFSGWNHMVEMYYQLSNQNLGKRQVKNADTVQWATPWGDSILMRRE